MNSSKTNIMYFILLLSLAILIFFTNSYYTNYFTKKQELDDKQKKLESLLKQNKNFNEIKLKLKKNWVIKKWKNEINKEVLNKYISDFNEKDFINYFYSLASKNNLNITNLTLNKWKLAKNWFFKWKINCNIAFPNENMMISFLEQLLSKQSRYQFYINKFSYPMGEIIPWKDIKIKIELIIYYK